MQAISNYENENDSNFAPIPLLCPLVFQAGAIISACKPILKIKYKISGRHIHGWTLVYMSGRKSSLNIFSMAPAEQSDFFSTVPAEQSDFSSGASGAVWFFFSLALVEQANLFFNSAGRAIQFLWCQWSSLIFSWHQQSSLISFQQHQQSTIFGSTSRAVFFFQQCQWSVFQRCQQRIFQWP